MLRNSFQNARSLITTKKPSKRRAIRVGLQTGSGQSCYANSKRTDFRPLIRRCRRELGALVRLIDEAKISGKQGKDVLIEMFKTGKPAADDH